MLRAFRSRILVCLGSRRLGLFGFEGLGFRCPSLLIHESGFAVVELEKDLTGS